MRHILSKKSREQHKLNGAFIEIKWTVSRGRKTHGYNICTLYLNGKDIASCMGKDYDMQGTVIASFILKYFPEELKKLNSMEYYGLVFSRKTKTGKIRGLKRYSPGAAIHLDGACGLSSMYIILERIGFRLVYVKSTGKTSACYALKISEAK